MYESNLLENNFAILGEDLSVMMIIKRIHSLHSLNQFCSLSSSTLKLVSNRARMEISFENSGALTYYVEIIFKCLKTKF
nr:hypothetical transcript [Hymenolepis microstoma]